MTLDSLCDPCNVYDFVPSLAFRCKMFFLCYQDLVLYYFSAHWCPPCRQFTPMLKDFYEVTRLLMKVKNKYVCQEAEGIEIVFVSSDRSAEDMTSYMKVMEA